MLAIDKLDSSSDIQTYTSSDSTIKQNSVFIHFVLPVCLPSGY